MIKNPLLRIAAAYLTVSRTRGRIFLAKSLPCFGLRLVANLTPIPSCSMLSVSFYKFRVWLSFFTTLADFAFFNFVLNGIAFIAKK